MSSLARVGQKGLAVRIANARSIADRWGNVAPAAGVALTTTDLNAPGERTTP